MPSKRRPLALAAALGLAALAVPAAPTVAHAFCGFYVGGGDAKLTNNATMVVLMREGMRTVLSMQNNYKGPPADFAMVVPVPIVLQKENVKTLPREVFDRVDLMASPRLVEYWEQDPCPEEHAGRAMEAAAAPGRAKMAAAPAAAADPNHGVRVEAEFTVGEYEVVVLSAQDSGGLDTWLRENKYKIPEGAEPVLRPYVAKGMKFFVAKVNASRARFEGGQAILSPLRFHYDSDDFSLPVRLGMLNSDGKQELVVHILARGKRYEVANYPNVTIPTNYDVAEEARERFGVFYAALFDATMEKHPGAVVTEYAWDAQSCDPCPGPTLGPADMSTLGADALAPDQPPAPDPSTPPRPTVNVGDVTSDDKVDNAAASVRLLLPNYTQCYTAELATSPGATGRAAVTATVEGRGVVRDAKVKVSGGLSMVLAGCVEQASRVAYFPAPAGGRATVKYALDFTLQPGTPAPPRQRMRGPNPWGFTLTRLHTRYAKDGLGQDLIFREAPPILGGREEYNVPEQDHGAKPGSTNNFQARYAIRHPWKGRISCSNPRRGVWGGPPPGEQGSTTPRAAQKIAYVKRENVSLASLVKQSIPDLGVTAQRTGATGGACGCATREGSGVLASCSLAALAALVLAARRRRG